MLIKLLLLFLFIFAFNVNALEKTVLYEGYTKTQIEEKVYRTEAELRSFLQKLDHGVDYSEFTSGENKVVVVIPGEESGYPSQLFVTKVEKDNDDNFKVYYTLEYPLTVLEKDPDLKQKPFVLLQLEEAGIAGKEIAIVNQDLEDVLIVDNSINQDVKYSNILKHQENYLFIEYFPLEKGNSWTYRIRNEDRTTTKSFEIVSFTEGWSVFDNFFGKYKTGFKIDPDGELLVSTKNGIRPFYNDQVKMEQKDELYEVEAGKFREILVVTIPENDNFWFKDVYAKDTGLIYHKHVSPAGEFEYSLVKASVGGRKIQ